jgi:hypothetical protein
MTRKSLSKHAKLQKQHQSFNTQMQEALDAYQLELQKDEHKCKGAQKIADIFDVNYRTLT